VLTDVTAVAGPGSQDRKLSTDPKVALPQQPGGGEPCAHTQRDRWPDQEPATRRTEDHQGKLMNTINTGDTTPPPAPLADAVTLLDQAARECAARGNTATSALDDLTIWHLDAQLVRLTAETLRSASPTELPESGDVPLPPGGDPLELVGGAWNELEKVPDRNWDSAEEVRRSWLADAFLTRTSPPKNAETFVALAVIHGERTEDYNSLYTTLTKAQSGYQATAALASRAEAGTPRQALMLALALLVCEWESRTSRDTWRRPGERDRRYLAALVQWGTSPPTSSSSC